MMARRAGGHKGIAHMALHHLIHSPHRAADRMKGCVHRMRHQNRVCIELDIAAVRHGFEQGLKIGLRVHTGDLLGGGFGCKVARQRLKFFSFQNTFNGPDPVWPLRMAFPHIMQQA